MVPVCPHTTVPHLGLQPQEKWGHWDLGLIRSWKEMARVSGAVAFHTATPGMPGSFCAGLAR